MANVIPLPTARHAEGSLPVRRVIFDAPKVRHQLDFLKTLRDDGVEHFAAVGRPVVVDHVGGLVGRALLAFGVASGIAHGLDEHLRFDATPWTRVRKESPDEDESRRGGAARRVLIALLDRSLTVPEVNALARAKGGTRLVVCQDPDYCRSLSDMVSHSRRHGMVQALKAMRELNQIPDLMRTQHFLEQDVAQADRFARQVKYLKPIAAELKPRSGQTQEQSAENLSARLAAQALRIERIRSSLENLHSVRGLDKPRVPAAHLAQRVVSKTARGQA